MGGFSKFTHVLCVVGGLRGFYVTHTWCTSPIWMAVFLWNQCFQWWCFMWWCLPRQSNAFGTNVACCEICRPPRESTLHTIPTSWHPHLRHPNWFVHKVIPTLCLLGFKGWQSSGFMVPPLPTLANHATKFSPRTPTYGSTQWFWQRATLKCCGGALGVICGMFFFLFLYIALLWRSPPMKSTIKNVILLLACVCQKNWGFQILFGINLGHALLGNADFFLLPNALRLLEIVITPKAPQWSELLQ